MKTDQIIHIDLLKADILRLLANCFDFPTQQRLDTVQELSDALRQTDYPDEEILTMIGTLHEVIDREEILNRYSFIFIKGGVPLNESHNLQRFNSVSDVTAFYHAFGFSPKSGDTPDSIMYELEFLALLLVKGVTAPNEEAADVTQLAYRDFILEHTADFAIALAQRIQEGSGGIYFLTVAHLLRAFFEQERVEFTKS